MNHPMDDTTRLLRNHDIQPTPQRLAVAMFVLRADDHPTAEEVWARVRADCRSISRATVYNTLNLLVDKGLLRQQRLKGGTSVYDRNVESHHHFIDDETGDIYDIPWDAFKVIPGSPLRDFAVRDYQVVIHGYRKKVSDPE